MRKIEINSDGRDFCTKNVNVTIVVAGRICFWRESEIRRSVLCCCAWKESGFDHGEGVFNIFNLVYKEFFKFCIFSATYKENAVNFIIFQQK
jgi:hypothetical protein